MKLSKPKSQLKDKLKDATDALTIVKAKFDVAEKAEKDSLVTSLVRDGNKPPVCFNILVQGVGFEPSTSPHIATFAFFPQLLSLFLCNLRRLLVERLFSESCLSSRRGRSTLRFHVPRKTAYRHDRN